MLEINRKRYEKTIDDFFENVDKLLLFVIDALGSDVIYRGD
jgi:hypothetical protein